MKRLRVDPNDIMGSFTRITALDANGSSELERLIMSSA